jgi:putative ABC transport system ATP-binding protein
MHLLGLLDRPTGGRYFFKGKEVSKFSDRELARFRGREIGFVFQAFNLLPRVSAQKNVELPMIYQGIRPKVRKEKALKILSGLGIGDRVKHKPTELSGGEQQRVALARALANDAPIILADEPTGNLDSVRTKEIMQILKKLNREGKTIIMVTHEPELVEYAQRLVSMKDGKIVSDQKVTKKLVANLKQLVLRR